MGIPGPRGWNGSRRLVAGVSAWSPQVILSEITRASVTAAVTCDAGGPTDYLVLVEPIGGGSKKYIYVAITPSHAVSDLEPGAKCQVTVVDHPHSRFRTVRKFKP
jgi:hypothetical protein